MRRLVALALTLLLLFGQGVFVMAFPQSVLGNKFELFYDNAWHDHSSDVRGIGANDGEIRLTARGNPDEGSGLNPTIASLSINNANGKYSPSNVLSPLYGKIGLNTPARISTDLGDTTSVVDDFSTNSASGWPNADSGHVYTSVGGAAGEYQVTGGEAYHYHNAVSTQHLSRLAALVISDFDVYLRGITLSAVPTGSGSIERGIRGRVVDSNNLVDVRLFSGTADDISIAVRQLVGGVETVSNFPTISGATSTTPVDLRFQAIGRTIRARAWPSSGAEPTTWNVTLTGVAHVTPGYMEIRSHLGSGITNALPYNIRFGGLDFSLGIILLTGEVSAWPVKWDTTGTDVWTAIEISGLTRHLRQGGAELLASPVRRVMERSTPTPVAYWAMEDEENALGFASIVPDTGRPMEVSTGAVNFAADSEVVGSKPLPTLAASTILAGSVPAYTGTNEWAYSGYFKLVTDISATTTILEIRTNSATARYWRLIATSGAPDSIYFRAYDNSGTELPPLIGSLAVSIEYNVWYHLRITAIEDTGDTQWQFAITDSSGVGGGASDVVASLPGIVEQVRIGGGAVASTLVADMGVGHVGVYDTVDNTFLSNLWKATIGWDGETAVERMQRLSTEEGITLRVTQGAVIDGEGTLVGPQTIDTYLNLMASAAAADDGILYELRDELGYGYKTRVSLLNGASTMDIDYAAAELSAVPEYRNDDQLIRNRVTAKRRGGSQATVEQTEGPLSTASPYATPPGAGVYESEYTVDVSEDSQLLDYAGWKVHKGTWDEAHWPTLTLAMHRQPFTGSIARITSAAFLEIGELFSIVNLPTWLPPDSTLLMMRAVSIILSNFTWSLEWTSTPAGPFNVAEMNNPALGRLDHDGSSLVTSIVDIGTELAALTEGKDSALWTEDIGELNFGEADGFDLRLNPPARAGGQGGERVRVGVSPAVIDSATRTVSNGFGTADSSQVWTVDFGAAAQHSVTGTRLRHTLNAVNVTQWASLDVLDIDHGAAVTLHQALASATGADIEHHLILRQSDTNNNYRVALVLTTGGQMTLQLIRTVGGVTTNLTTALSLGAHVAGSPWRIKGMIYNSQLYAKAWRPSAGGEPDWQLMVRDTAHKLSTATRSGLRARLVTGNTNPLPVLIEWDDLEIYTPKVRPYAFDYWNRTVVDGLGSANSGGAWSLVFSAPGSAADYDVANNAATTVLGAANGYRAAYLDDIDLRDACVAITWTCPTPTGANLEPGGIALRGTGITSYILCRAHVTTASVVTLEINSAAGASLGTTTVWGLTHAPGTPLRTKAMCLGDQIMMKVWDPTQHEPHYWQLIVTDPAAVISGWVGWRNGRAFGNTNVNPTPSMTDFAVHNPQKITVARNINGGGRAWDAGTDIRLWSPLRLSR